MITGWQYIREWSPLANQMIQRIFGAAIPYLKEVQTVIPTTNTLPQGWACLYQYGTTVFRIYFNINGYIRYTSVSGGTYIDEPKNVTPTPVTNGVQTLFTLPEAYVANSLEVYMDGLRQIKTTDYVETNPGAGTFTMTSAPLALENLRCDYIKA